VEKSITTKNTKCTKQEDSYEQPTFNQIIKDLFAFSAACATVASGRLNGSQSVSLDQMRAFSNSN
jgi:hypothetical protein